jgi:glyoxylase-like metal-dependent hydrolase (beta-lactamase superfamily II)
VVPGRSRVRRVPPAGCARVWRVAGSALAACLSLAACTRDLDLIQHPPRAVAVTTTGPWASLIYAARTDSGVIVIDLGWGGAGRALRTALSRVGATPADVRFVFLTHAHRDHVSAWPMLRGARFVLGSAEVPYFTGVAQYRAFLPHLLDRLWSYPRPAAGELRLLPVATDSIVALGGDSVLIRTVAGHTPGSVAYIFRGILFGGDAINWRPLAGFRGARPEFSDDAGESRASMRALWERLPAGIVRIACTAHAKCVLVDSSFMRATER